MINSNDNNLIAFQAIAKFSNELSLVFGDDNHPLKLYDRLITKTSVSHDKAIKKHIDIFRQFCIDNREALINKDAKQLIKSRIVYSIDRVYIDFSKIFQKADKEERSVIWKHLLTISALLDPAANAKEILKNEKDSTEADFLSDIISKVETHVKPDSNPMEAVSAIMSSGVFTELIQGMNSGMQNGSLDLGKLMGTVQKMCTSLSSMQGREDTNIDPSMLNNIVNSMSNSSGDSSSSGTVPDMSQLMNMFGPMFAGGMQNSGVSVEEKLD